MLRDFFFVSRELIQKHKVCIRILGDVELLPVDVQKTIAKAVVLSRNNKRSIDMTIVPWTFAVNRFLVEVF